MRSRRLAYVSAGKVPAVFTALARTWNIFAENGPFPMRITVPPARCPRRPFVRRSSRESHCSTIELSSINRPRAVPFIEIKSGRVRDSVWRTAECAPFRRLDIAVACRCPGSLSVINRVIFTYDPRGSRLRTGVVEPRVFVILIANVRHAGDPRFQSTDRRTTRGAEVFENRWRGLVTIRVIETIRFRGTIPPSVRFLANSRCSIVSVRRTQNRSFAVITRAHAANGKWSDTSPEGMKGRDGGGTQGWTYGVLKVSAANVYTYTTAAHDSRLRNCNC